MTLSHKTLSIGNIYKFIGPSNIAKVTRHSYAKRGGLNKNFLIFQSCFFMSTFHTVNYIPVS